MTHLLYFCYLLRHKWFVLVAGLHVGAPIWRLLLHDLSKFRPSEWFPYVEKFYGMKREVGQLTFDLAWCRHQNRNDHHWQHYFLVEDSGTIKILPMPETAIREMVADWASVGRVLTGEWDVVNWYAENSCKMKLHRDTRQVVEDLVGRFALEA